MYVLKDVNMVKQVYTEYNDGKLLTVYAMYNLVKPVLMISLLLKSRCSFSYIYPLKQACYSKRHYSD